MQIVIDLSEEDYKSLKNLESYIRQYSTSLQVAVLDSIVLDGIILPNSHGDLIDRDELKKYAGWYNLATDKSIHAVLTKEIDWVKPIIRATEGEVND